jgi:hypothetical protein
MCKHGADRERQETLFWAQRPPDRNTSLKQIRHVQTALFAAYRLDTGEIMRRTVASAACPHLNLSNVALPL